MAMSGSIDDYLVKRSRAMELGDRNLVVEINYALARLGYVDPPGGPPARSVGEPDQPETVVESRELEAVVPKRGPGRPRKHPLPQR